MISGSDNAMLEDLDAILAMAKRKVSEQGVIFENQWLALKENYHGQGAEEAQSIVFQLKNWLGDYTQHIEHLEKMSKEFKDVLETKGEEN